MEYNTLFADSWNLLVNLLKTNVTDPINRHKRDIIFSQRQMDKTNFVGYPYVVVYPISSKQVWRTNCGTKSMQDVSFNIEILSSDNPNLDSLTDNVMAVLFSSTYQATLQNSGLANFAHEAVNGSEEDYEGKRIFVRTITCSFKLLQSLA